MADKFRIYYVLMDIYANRKDILEAIDLGLSVLEKCGHKFPKKKFAIVAKTLRGIIKIKSPAFRKT